MSCSYTPVSITGYNASPPPDDGTEVSGNVIKWSNHKDKLGDPLKTAIEAIDSNLQTYSSCVASTYMTKTEGQYAIQVVRTVDATNQTGTTVMPADNTIPQSSEGDEYITVAITPAYDDSTLIVHGLLIAYMNSTGPDPLVCALFKDSETDARAAFEVNMTGNSDRMPLPVHYSMTSGSTSEITFKLRAGRGNSNGTLMGINGRYSTKAYSFLEVIEVPA